MPPVHLSLLTVHLTNDCIITDSRGGLTNGDVHRPSLAERSETVQRAALVVVLHQLYQTFNSKQTTIKASMKKNI